MKRIFCILVILTIYGTASADKLGSVMKLVGLDKTPEAERTESKFNKFNQCYDGFIRYTDYDIPGLKTSDALKESAKIRRYMDIHTDESTFFLLLTIGKDNHTEAIAHEDLIKVIDALKILSAKCAQDKENKISTRCYYTTVDGFRIGYNANDGKASWFFTVRGIECKFSKDFDFESTLIDAKNKMAELSKLKQELLGK